MNSKILLPKLQKSSRNTFTHLILTFLGLFKRTLCNFWVPRLTYNGIIGFLNSAIEEEQTTNAYSSIDETLASASAIIAAAFSSHGCGIKIDYNITFMNNIWLRNGVVSDPAII